MKELPPELPKVLSAFCGYPRKAVLLGTDANMANPHNSRLSSGKKKSRRLTHAEM